MNPLWQECLAVMVFPFLALALAGGLLLMTACEVLGGILSDSVDKIFRFD
jgi:hypothetical protein